MKPPIGYNVGMKVDNHGYKKSNTQLIIYDLVTVCTGVGWVLEIATRPVADQSGYQG
jgi:hypothetical protein